MCERARSACAAGGVCVRACQCAPSKKCPVCTPCTSRTHSAPARGGRRHCCWKRWAERDRRVSSNADGAGGRTRWRVKWGWCSCVCVRVRVRCYVVPLLSRCLLASHFPPSLPPSRPLSASIQPGFPTSHPCLSQEWYSQTFSELFIDRCQLFSIPLVCTLWEMRGFQPRFPENELISFSECIFLTLRGILE